MLAIRKICEPFQTNAHSSKTAFFPKNYCQAIVVENYESFHFISISGRFSKLKNVFYPGFICSKSAIETLEKSVKYVQS